MKTIPNTEVVVFCEKQDYSSFLDRDIDNQKLKLIDSSLDGIQNENNVIINVHGSSDGRLDIGNRLYYPIDIIYHSRSNGRGTRCFDIFSCHIGTGIQSSNTSRQWSEERYRRNLLKGEYVILNGGNKATSATLNRVEIARTVKEGDDKCPPYIRVLRRMCNYPETIKFLYVVKEVNPETKELENKLVTYKFSALKITPPEQVTIDKIRTHLLDSMEQFKNEFLLYADEGEKEQIESEIEKEIERLKEEVLSKDDHLTTYGNKTLFIEASRGRINRVETYLESDKFYVDYAIENGDTPLYIASFNGHLEIVEFLLRKGAKVDLGNKDGETPLYIASQEGHLKVIELLLRNGANPNIACSDGITPLYMASQQGHIEIVDIFLKVGADLNLYCSGNRATPLHIALYNGHTKVVKLLLSQGANSNVSSSDGTTPLYLASQNGYIQIVKMLLKEGAKPNLVCNNGRSSLIVASEGGYLGVIKLLLNAGADPSLARNDGVTPIFMASENGHSEVVKLLLNAGGDPNVFRNDGVTPIVMAIFRNNIEVVKVLLPKVDLSMCYWRGKSVDQLIKGEIQDEEEKRKLLKTLSSKENPSTSPNIHKSELTVEKSKACTIL